MNVFVTGGSRGIGRAIVLELVSSGKGCAFTYAHDEAAAEETCELARASNANVNVKAYRLDCSDPSMVEAVGEQVIDDFRDIGGVVNNAGIVANNAAVLMSNEEWDRVIGVDLSGPFYVIRAFLMHLLSRKHGRIVNISSLAHGGSSGQVNYAAAKAGLLGITRTIAKEYGAKGITCNAVTVGYVETDMTNQHMADQLKKFWVTHCPTKRVGFASEVADAVHFLLREEAGFINGENLHIAGGLTYAP